MNLLIQVSLVCYVAMVTTVTFSAINQAANRPGLDIPELGRHAAWAAFWSASWWLTVRAMVALFSGIPAG